MRGLVAAICRDRGLPAELTDSIVLAIDELAVNALRHGNIEVRTYDHPPTFAVADARPGAEVVRRHLRGQVVAADDAERGRGLMVVAALFPEATVVPTILASGEPGKEIRFAVEPEGPDTGDSGSCERADASEPAAGEVGRALGGRG